MADLKISELESANVLGGSDLLYVVQDGASKKIAASALFSTVSDPTLVGNIQFGSTAQILTTAGKIDISIPRTLLIGGVSANTLAIANGNVLPSTLFLYTPGVQGSGTGLRFIDGTSTTEIITVTYANGKILLNGYFPNQWGGASPRPFQYGLNFVRGSTYIFDVSDVTNTGNILSFSTSIDGTNTSGTNYTANVSRNGSPGSVNANIVFTPGILPIDTGGINLLDIPDGYDGQLKIITLTETGGGSFSLVSNIINNININFTKAGDSVILINSGNVWAIAGTTPGFQSTFTGTTDTIPEGLTNLYFANTRSRNAISAGTGISYNPATGVISANISSIGNINISAVATTDQINEGAANLYFTNARAIAAIVNSTALLNSGAVGNVANVIFVATNGNDANPGNSIERPLANIHTALSKANSWTTVRVMSGQYTLYNQPVTIKNRVALVGDNLRTTSVYPSNTSLDMFYVENGSYVTGFTFRNHISPAAVFSYNPNGSAGFISTSPYIQNCSSITTTGTGMRVDGRYVTGLRSMVCDSYTQTNEGGIGIHMLNRGYTQLVSVFTICCNVGILCEEGGFCSITNSNTSFGTYGLVARGVSEKLYSGQIVSIDPDNPSVFTITNLKTPAGVNQKPNYGDALLIANFNQTKCSRDTGLIVDALLFDMLTNGTTESTFAGLQYYSQSESAIPGQSVETIAALSYAKQLSTNVIINTTIANVYQTSNLQVIDNTVVPSSLARNKIGVEYDIILDIIASGTVGVTDRIEPNRYPANTNSLINGAANLLIVNKNFIQSEVVAFVQNVYPTFSFNAATCFRDVGYIVDSIVFDLRYSGNKQAVTSGVYYYNYNANSSQINNQVVQTANAYDYIGTLIDNIITANTQGYTTYQNAITQNTTAASAVSNAIVLSRLRTNIDYLSNIIIQGPSVAAPKKPISLSIDRSTAVDNAAKLIYANRDFVKAEVLEYVNQNWANISNGTSTFYTVVSSTNLLTGANVGFLPTSTVTILETPAEVILANSRVSFHQPSYISASSHTMEYVGSGTALNTALPYLGGIPVQENEVVEERGGLVFYTSTDHLGDFRIGDNFTINRVDGTITGRTFTKALFSVLTPYILAIEG